MAGEIPGGAGNASVQLQKYRLANRRLASRRFWGFTRADSRREGFDRLRGRFVGLNAR
jgi:hypothetical protein